MARAECYNLHLYCDNPKARHGIEHPFGYFPHEFTGHTQAEVYRDARAAGWKLARRGGETHDRCPRCVRAAAGKPLAPFVCTTDGCI